jgi:tRNA uridine 5-carboxymethylaminomethyl modification enzyme
MVWQYPNVYDVIVVGGGHAGCEAAHAAAKMGAHTLLLTMNPSTIGQMSCNPSIGGIAKGHIVREVDALGGIMGKATDQTGLQFRMLNTSRGPAVQSPRAQADKDAYKQWMKLCLERTPNLEIKQGTCEAILVKDGHINGVVIREGISFTTRSVVITTGTFLRGLIHIGDVNFSGGRGGEPAAMNLSESLQEHGIRLGRLKTGTPVRVHKRSIDYSLADEQPGEPSVYFSYDEKVSRLPQVMCHIVYTNKDTKEVIQKNLHRSPLYGGKIHGVGPRYCPSIEDKIVRFSDKDHHQVFLEPEGRDTDEVYTSGLSSSLPVDVQYALVRTIPALRNAEIIRPAYAIEYDYVVSGQIDYSLQSKAVQGLFFAGQINGTTGYEEAAGQGLIAGINAVQSVRQENPLILTRDTSYIGVMIDDLVTKGVDEPYRMFTSRAEHRLLLRQDNADLRLRHFGYNLGLISEEQYQRLLQKKQSISSETAKLSSTYKTLDGKTCPLSQFLARPEVTYKDLVALFPNDVTDHGDDTNAQIEIGIKYDGYISRQVSEVAKLSAIEECVLPQDIDYHAIKGLRTEAKLRLSKNRPQNLGQASRIPGIAPSDISVLMIALKHMSCHESVKL